MPELAFVVPDTGPDPAADLIAALSEEVGRQDAVSLICTDFPEPRPDRVYVVLGANEGTGAGSTEAQLSRAIVVLLAPPGSTRFASEAELARRAGAAFHVNSVATERLLEVGVPARHLQLGYSPAWEVSSPAFASTELIAIDDSGGYFDWVRALRAIHGGAVVLHEHALGRAPLVAGRHLFLAAPDALAAISAALLDDRQRLDRVRREALDFAREALPLALAAAALIGTARTLVAQPLPVAVAATPGQPTSRSK